MNTYLGEIDQEIAAKHLLKHPFYLAWTRGELTAEGLAALYAYESQIPAICESKIDGLRRYYGFGDSKHYHYFTVHLAADREHSAAERKMLIGYIDQQNFESVKASVNRVLESLWDMLSAICRVHAIPC